MPETPRLLSSAEACKRINIDRSTLSRWIKFGEAVPAMQLPTDKGAYLFTVEEVERLAAKREQDKAKAS